jgi:hypothetical protein
LVNGSGPACRSFNDCRAARIIPLSCRAAIAHHGIGFSLPADIKSKFGVRLFPVINDKSPYHSRHPAGKGEEENDEERAAPLVYHCQWREKDANENAPDTHYNLLFADFESKVK